MRFVQRRPGAPARLGIFPGAFNPLTVAHIALARAALASSVEEVLFILPETFPHKPYAGASFQDRMEMLRVALAGEPAFSLAVSQGGLFAEIAAECRQVYTGQVALSFLCGRDAAERFVNWDYGASGIPRGFGLLVAAREGEYNPPPEFPAAVARLRAGAECIGVSATEVRRRIAAGEPWEYFVPEAIRELVRGIYRR
ncbi:MAG: hypothetical protein LAQ30_25720 [Acidobacteriia bacterium]|nr:hypothetical protein [Terriglobia bacterium]